MKKYYHIYSDGATGNGLFESTADFIAAMNRLAICAAYCDVEIIAFVFEDTHVHFVVCCTEENCAIFKRLFKKLTLTYISITRPREERLATMDFSVYELNQNEDETLYDVLKHEIAYCVIQPTKDGKRVMPYDYLWGTGSMYFRSKGIPSIWRITRQGEEKPITQVKDYNKWKRAKIFRTTLDIPEHWYVCNGIILPENYVSVEKAEEILGSPNAYRALMARKIDDKVIKRMSRARGISLENKEMRLACIELCKEIFHEKSVKNLDAEQRLIIARRLRQKYVSTYKQIATTVHLPLIEIIRNLK